MIDHQDIKDLQAEVEELKMGLIAANERIDEVHSALFWSDVVTYITALIALFLSIIK